MNRAHSHIDFVIGAEKRIAEIISPAEIEPLLRSLVMAGPLYAAVLDENNLPICEQGTTDLLHTAQEFRHGLLVEGEPKGALVVSFDPDQTGPQESLSLLARAALQLIITNNLKRMLTTEIHTTVVKDSYEQLLEINRSLAESEKCYRELSLSLEQKVEQRTAELQKAYARMLQQEKLAAVGSLAAGMAHEINNPNGFVRCNLSTFDRYFQRMKAMIDNYQHLVASETPLSQLQQETEKNRRELKIDLIMKNTPEMLSQSIEGTDRIARIVADLKSFSHVDDLGESAADLNEELKRTLAVLEPQIPADTAVLSELRPLPPFICHAGLISQAFFNILQNALQSRREGLQVHISSACSDDGIDIVITDNGCGIAPENLSRVFDPFFTTRDVGSGTGMGLTVARELIRCAGGTVQISSREGSGTSVTIQLPLASKGR
ncbi:MAG: histidine kinase [Geobacteraceae bacterium]|nr:histidine kinase [Geobacteraceae bacterium]